MNTSLSKKEVEKVRLIVQRYKKEPVYWGFMRWFVVLGITILFCSIIASKHAEIEALEGRRRLIEELRGATNNDTSDICCDMYTVEADNNVRVLSNPGTHLWFAVVILLTIALIRNWNQHIKEPLKIRVYRFYLEQHDERPNIKGKADVR
ncbi:MAG: hypothetical protein GY854_10755 [Deltaproteobacteria bacterium]|nr:hypothetical protein [Deltaproteobacteria bacterium]